MTFATATPLQRAVAFALEEISDEYYAELRADYDRKRKFLSSVLTDVGFEVAPCQGTYFLLANFSNLDPGDDLSFTKRLIEEVGVAAIPPSVFYKADPEEGQSLVRFAFCKRDETLEAAAERLKRLVS